MSRRTLLLVTIVGIAVAIAGGVVAARWASSPHSQPPAFANLASLEIEQTAVGDVASSPKARVVVRLRNTGSESIRVDRFVTACCDNNISPSACVVSPGEAITLTVVLDLMPSHIAEYGRLSWPFDFQLTAESGSPTQKRRWRITGTCRATFAVNTPVLHLGEANVVGRTAVSRPITVLLADPTLNVNATTNMPGIRILGIEHQPDHAVIRVAPDTTTVCGAFSGRIGVEVTTSDGRVVGSTNVEVYGVVRDPIAVERAGQ